MNEGNMKMIKKLIAILILVFALACFAGCGAGPAGEEYPGLEKLIELTQPLAESYNEIAETAINNGWEYDDETVEQMDKIATVIDTINEGIVAPETFEEGQIEELIKSAKELTEELKEIKEKISVEYEIEGMTSTTEN